MSRVHHITCPLTLVPGCAMAHSAVQRPLGRRWWSSSRSRWRAAAGLYKKERCFICFKKPGNMFFIELTKEGLKLPTQLLAAAGYTPARQDGRCAGGWRPSRSSCGYGCRQRQDERCNCACELERPPIATPASS